MTLLVICLVILLIITLVLVLPVSVEITATFSGRVDVRLRIYYFLRLLGWEPGKQKGNSRKARSEETEKPVPTVSSRLYRAVRVKGVWDRAWLLVKRLFSGMKIHNLESDLKISLVDDYYTGMLAGLLMPLVLFLNTRFSSSLKFQPAFEEEFIFDGYLSGIFQVRPISLLFPFIAFMFSHPGWRVVRIMAGGK